MSGARVLAVGFCAEDIKKGKRVQKEKKMEAAVGKVPHSKELKKLWTEAMLLPEQKEQQPADWNPEPYKQGENETAFDLEMQDQKETNSELKHHENVYGGKVVVNSRVVSIPVNVSDVPGSVSDNFHVTMNNATTASNTVAISSCNSDLVNTSFVSDVMPGDLHIKKSYQTEDTSVISELEPSSKVVTFEKRPSISGKSQSSTESQRRTTLPSGSSWKAYKGTVPTKIKSKGKSTLSLSNITREKKSSLLPSLYIQESEIKQESIHDESLNDSITLYKGDGSNGQSKCEMAVVNANKQAYTIKQSSALCGPSSLKSLQLQKTNSVLGYAVNKISKASVDKKKVKLRNQPIGSVLRAKQITASQYEGNVIVGYQCPKCNKVYQTEWLMMKHSVTHFKYHCDICSQVFPTENMMKIHLLNHLSGAYEDEKYYCQFSCKICHSLKCGCYEPTYCKPQDLPRLFFRPQKAKRSKKVFTSKLNSGPNDHLKISLSSYKKLLLSESLGNPTKEKSENSTSQKPVLIEDAQKLIVLKEEQKATSMGDSQISPVVIRNCLMSNVQKETPKIHVERENLESINIKEDTSQTILTKERGSDSVPGEQLEVRPNVSEVGQNLITKREKLGNWKQLKRKLMLNYKSDVIPSPKPSCVNDSEKTENAPGTKRAGKRKRINKLSSNFIYEDADLYYMCEICDASFSTKAELSEHMFLHRLKSRCRRGEKRGISSLTEEVPKKPKIHELQDEAVIKTFVGFENKSCELCHITFSTVEDYNAHKILAHKEPKTQNMEVYRCNYCDKIYRRRRELKRHLKRDCNSAPPSLKGELSGPSCSTNVIEESHYTTMNVDFIEKSHESSKSVGKGPIICRYCLAMTKREAEMKRHIWKFCLKVPSDVVKKFMDGASLEQLGFKYLKDDTSTQTSPTDSPQNIREDISGTQSAVMDTLNEIHSIKNPKVSEELSPEKQTSMDVKTYVQLELPETSNSTKYSLQISPDKKILTLHEDTSQDSNIARHETVQDVFDDFNNAKPSLEMETSYVQPVPSEEQSISTVHTIESKKTDDTEPAKKQSPTKLLSEETKMELSSPAEEVAQSAASTSPLASPVMQFPIVLPVKTTTAKSKKPLVCGYCGIWYFREMAILKHMKERCIKIPDFEKEHLKENNTLCNVPQKAGGVGIVSENGAVYKMVKMPEYMEKTPVPMPKDVSNEDIKELNTNIKVYSDSTAKEDKQVHKQENISSLSVLPPLNQICKPSKKGSRCRRCHEHFSSQEAVLAHSSVHHGPKKGFYKCKLCHARLAKYKQLREHVWEHTDENPYRCHLCLMKYRFSDALVEHLHTLHQFTSINDKNLYKWLPGRLGKYRDIKTKNTNCEEKLDDVDTNLDSLAEVMVITDKDICSNTTSDFKLKKNENEVKKIFSGMHKQLDNSEKIKEKGDNLQVGSICSKENSTENSLSNETKAVQANSDCNVDSNKISEDITADKVDNFAEGERNTMEENSGNIISGIPSVNAKVLEESEVEEQTSPTVSCTSNKSKSSHIQQNDVTIIERKDVDNNTERGRIVDFSEEGLLPHVENIDSVVETIQLTDKYLS